MECIEVGTAGVGIGIGIFRTVGGEKPVFIMLIYNKINIICLGIDRHSHVFGFAPLAQRTVGDEYVVTAYGQMRPIGTEIEPARVFIVKRRHFIIQRIDRATRIDGIVEVAVSENRVPDIHITKSLGTIGYEVHHTVVAVVHPAGLCGGGTRQVDAAIERLRLLPMPALALRTPEAALKFLP